MEAQNIISYKPEKNILALNNEGLETFCVVLILVRPLIKRSIVFILKKMKRKNEQKQNLCSLIESKVIWKQSKPVLRS